MPAFTKPVVGGWRVLVRFADGPRAVPALFLLALLVYGAVSLAVPLSAGRDLARYLLAYVQLFDAHVVYPQAIVTRTPGTSVLAGGLLSLGSPFVAEAAAGVLYALSVVAWFSAARRVSPAVGVATGIAVLMWPGYVLLYHELSSDMLFAAAFALLALVLALTIERPTVSRGAALGGTVALLFAMRPTSVVLLVLVLVPIFAARGRGRLLCSGAFAIAAVVPLLAWAVHNQVRFDDFTIVRGGAGLPLYRAFVEDRIVEPENGPATRAFAQVVRRELLPREPYRSYGITLDQFFSSGSFRMFEDLVVLDDQVWGWDDDYRHLSRVGREAVLAHPGTYARGVVRDLRKLVWWPLYAASAGGSGSAGGGGAASSAQPTTATGLPVPTEGEPIPSSREPAYISTPDRRIRDVWTSATEHHLVFRDPADGQRTAAIDRHIAELLSALPTRGGSSGLRGVVNDLSRIYPRPAMWLLAGLVLVAIRRPRRASVPLVLSIAALLILTVTALAVYAVAEYSVPVTPAFVFLAAAGAFGARKT